MSKTYDVPGGALASYSASSLPPQLRTPVLAMPFTLKLKGLKNLPPEGLPTLKAPLYSILPAACSLISASVRTYLFWKWTLPPLKANLQICKMQFQLYSG